MSNPYRRREDKQPWHHQFWPWFLMALPASAVLGSLATIYLALANPNAMVVDDYYKEGLAINTQLDEEHTAAHLKLQAQGNTDDGRHEVEVDLSGQLEAYPPVLQLALIHPTLAHRDQTLLLSQDTPGVYRTRIATPLSGTRLVRLSPPDKHWRLDGRVNFDTQQNWVLKPII
jgi:hypothetical protein